MSSKRIIKKHANIAIVHLSFFTSVNYRKVAVTFSDCVFCLCSWRECRRCWKRCNNRCMRKTSDAVWHTHTHTLQPSLHPSDVNAFKWYCTNIISRGLTIRYALFICSVLGVCLDQIWCSCHVIGHVFMRSVHKPVYHWLKLTSKGI